MSGSALESALAGAVLVLGGARSGKSAYAESVGRAFARPALVASARVTPSDEELRARVERHRAQRPPGWITLEPEDSSDEMAALATIARREGPAAHADLVVFDCATLWLAWRLTQDHARYSPRQLVSHLEGEIRGLVVAIQNLRARGIPCVVVSNEVGSGVVPATPTGRAFRDALGLLNCALADACGLTVLLVAGQPLCLSGVERVAPRFARKSEGDENTPGFEGVAPLFSISASAVSRYLEGPLR